MRLILASLALVLGASLVVDCYKCGGSPDPCNGPAPDYPPSPPFELPREAGPDR